MRGEKGGMVSASHVRAHTRAREKGVNSREMAGGQGFSQGSGVKPNLSTVSRGCINGWCQNVVTSLTPQP